MPFYYPHIFLLFLGYDKDYFHLPNRQTIWIKDHAKVKVPSIHDFTTINKRRLDRSDIKIKRYDR